MAERDKTADETLKERARELKRTKLDRGFVCSGGDMLDGPSYEPVRETAAANWRRRTNKSLRRLP